MIEKKDIVEIGKFQKTHALKGELNALLNVPEEYVEDGNPLIVEMDGILVPFYAESVRPKGATSFLVKLQGIDSQDAAREMVNSVIFAPKTLASDYFGDEGEELIFNDDLEGFKVVDCQLGEIGMLISVNDYT